MNIKENFSKDAYDEMMRELFVRFPSFQNTGTGAYKPGLDRMEFFDSLAGHPHRKYKTIHIAGTNGKGSVSNMIAAALSGCGLNVGIYTSPHIRDFRERMRIIHGRRPLETGSPKMHNGTQNCGCSPEYISEEEVWDFVQKWNESFEHLEMSFFEITTVMAFSWFADKNVDIAVIETGLGGRLDSTNIITPELSVITNIGLDHCDLLGETLCEIAFEKAGIIKQGVPAVVGESNPETDTVFERKVLYTNLSSADFMGDRSRIMNLLTFADKSEPYGWELQGEILDNMDLQGEYQKKNLRTALSAIENFKNLDSTSEDIRKILSDKDMLKEALVHTARTTGFRGRWEKVSDKPLIICDIGHNAHGLKYNFAQLGHMLESGKCTSLIIVYGIVADKDLDAIFPLMPDNATYIFTNSEGKRALSSKILSERFSEYIKASGRTLPQMHCTSSVKEAVETALKTARTSEDETPLIYIGGSTFIVSEALEIL